VDKEPVTHERAVLRAKADMATAQASVVKEDTTTILANQNAPKEICFGGRRGALAGAVSR
jgi:hypothetical protein